MAGSSRASRPTFCVPIRTSSIPGSASEASMDRVALALLDGTNAVLVLILVSLGLAVIFGLMNVINMAHGEFLMLGAYAMLSLTRLRLPFLAGLALAPLL